MLDPALLAGGGLDQTLAAINDDVPRSIQCKVAATRRFGAKHSDCNGDARCHCACHAPIGWRTHDTAEDWLAEEAEPRYALIEAGLRFLAFALGADLNPGLASDLADPRCTEPEDDVCLAGSPARDGVCGDLDCVCAPPSVDPEGRA